MKKSAFFYKTVLIVTVISSMFLSSCNKDEIVQFTSPNDIVGFVSLRDEFGNVLADQSGMKVTITNVSPAVDAFTDTNGKYLLSNIKGGTYNLSYLKKGFGEFKKLSISHLGGNVPSSLGNQNLWETAKTIVTDITATVGIDNSITISGKSSPVQPNGTSSSQQRRLRLFFGKNTGVTYLNYDATFNQLLIPAPAIGSNGDWSIKLSVANFSPLKSGDNIKITAYGISPLENAYTDINTNKVIYSGVNQTKSNEVSVALP